MISLEFVEDIRAFNRSYTKVLGLLNSSYLDSDFSLTETRVLFEIYSRNGCTANDLCSALDLDKGYMSRIIRKFADAGLLSRTVSESDGRAQRILLTGSGKKVIGQMIDRSNAQIRSLFSSLSDEELQEVHSAITTIKRCITEQSERK
ncbi:MAG: winged helix-turn-helix transcriptional regulator [Lachnospiraceae bacterium]|nr:winged helix-turn-helix transcriptional regulator [Lachnospiraceae bacterium]